MIWQGLRRYDNFTVVFVSKVDVSLRFCKVGSKVCVSDNVCVVLNRVEEAIKRLFVQGYQSPIVNMKNLKRCFVGCRTDLCGVFKEVLRSYLYFWFLPFPVV